MKNCHNVILRVFVYEHEDNARILETLKELSGAEVKVSSTETKAGDEKSLIIIHKVTLAKDRQINAFLKKLTSSLSEEQKEMLIRQENRLDDDGNYFVRLDKNKLLEGIYHITDRGSCFHIRLCLAAFPKTKEKCLQKIREIFKTKPDN